VVPRGTAAAGVDGQHVESSFDAAHVPFSLPARCLAPAGHESPCTVSLRHAPARIEPTALYEDMLRTDERFRRGIGTRTTVPISGRRPLEPDDRGFG
jgi:hypothetical protein